MSDLNEKCDKAVNDAYLCTIKCVLDDFKADNDHNLNMDRVKTLKRAAFTNSLSLPSTQASIESYESLANTLKDTCSNELDLQVLSLK